MNCLSQVRLYGAAVFKRTGHLIATTSLKQCRAPSWKRNVEHYGIRATDLEYCPFHVKCCYSTKSSKGKASRSKKVKSEPIMEEENDAFFVVRKGDVVAVYKNFVDCQAQVGSSVCDPPVSVYKGYSLPKDTVDYLTSHGLQNALYTISAADLKDDLFGKLMPCPVQDPDACKGETSSKDTSKKRIGDMLELETGQVLDSTSTDDPWRTHADLYKDQQCCILEFDGASKGNPGLAGAAAVLRTTDGKVICKLREGLGIATNNVAEYRAMILGLKYALKMGYTNIQVHGDSKLVCMQIQDRWKVKHEAMSKLHKEAKVLKDKFLSFKIDHVLRGLNTDADAEANLAIHLADGQVQEELC